MDGHEAGKKCTERFVTEAVRKLGKEGSVDAFLWQPEERGGSSRPDDTTVQLRMYKENSWRQVGFAGSDIDGSVDNPEVLKKYEGEIAQALAEFPAGPGPAARWGGS